MHNIEHLTKISTDLHGYFRGIFFSLIGFFILVSVILEYFRIPLGGKLSSGKVLARSFLATIILICFKDVANIINSVTTALANDLGGFNQIELVKSEMAKRLETINFSWISMKNFMIVMISYFCFWILHFSVYICEGLLLYTWLMCYVLAPLLIAFYVFESTQSATTALFRSMIEASLWKIFWSVSASLLWSTALIDLNENPETDFIVVIGLILFLSASLLATPLLTHLLISKGLAGAASMMQVAALPGIPTSLGSIFSRAKQIGTKSKSATKNMYQNFSQQRRKTTKSAAK